MRIGIVDRILIFVGAFFAALIGVALVLAGLQTGGIDVGSTGVSLHVTGWVIVLCGALLFLFGVYLMSMPAKYRKAKDDFVLQQTASGELRISVNAIESLVQKVFVEHQEATLSRLEILNQRDGVVVDMGISLADNVSIPLLVGALQKQVKQHLLSSAGVDVKEVKVAVDTTDAHVKHSPYLVSNAELTQEADTHLNVPESHEEPKPVPASDKAVEVPLAPQEEQTEDKPPAEPAEHGFIHKLWNSKKKDGIEHEEG